MPWNLFGDFLLWRLLTDFRRCDLSGRCRYPRGWKMSHRFHRFTQIFLGTFFVTQISQMTQIFFHRDFFSSDATEFILRFPAAAITHGFSQMRPVRSLQIPPESGKSPTDFTDLHRFFLGHFWGHADFADDADFFLMGFYSSDDTEFIRRFPAVAITHGFSRMRPVRSLQIPPEIGQRDSPEIS